MTKKLPRTALWLMGFLLFLSLFRDVIANGRPLYCRIGGQSYWPGLRTVFVAENAPYEAEPLRTLQLKINQFEVWKDPANFDAAPVYAPIPFSAGEHSSLEVNAFFKPGSTHSGLGSRFVHWLGTDSDGRDVAATVVSGARIALMSGALAMLVALTIGLALGMIAGFFGDDRLKVGILELVFTLLGIPAALFYGFTVREYDLTVNGTTTVFWKSVGIFILILLIFNRVGKWLQRLFKLSKRVIFPADMVVMRIAEVFAAIPRLILVIVMAVALQGLTKESIWLMIALIGAFGWTGVAKYVRAELLKVRALEYVTAARGLGISEWRVLWKHALPNTLRPIYISVAFGVGSAVLLESYLSFLGFGGASFKGISWGSLFLNDNSSANPIETWWVTFFPGLMIFLTVLSLNRIGEALSDRN